MACRCLTVTKSLVSYNTSYQWETRPTAITQVSKGQMIPLLIRMYYLNAYLHGRHQEPTQLQFIWSDHHPQCPPIYSQVLFRFFVVTVGRFFFCLLISVLLKQYFFVLEEKFRESDLGNSTVFTRCQLPLSSWNRNVRTTKSSYTGLETCTVCRRERTSHFGSGMIRHKCPHQVPASSLSSGNT